MLLHRGDLSETSEKDPNDEEDGRAIDERRYQKHGHLQGYKVNYL
jgi:hypothetical protein